MVRASLRAVDQLVVPGGHVPAVLEEHRVISLLSGGRRRGALPREFHVPRQAARIGHRVLVDDLLQRLAQQQLLDRAVSCFLPDSVRGTSATCKISFGTKRGDSAVRMAPLIFALHGVVQRDAWPQHHEQRHVAVAAQVLEVDHQRVQHLRQRLHRAVQLAGPHAQAMAVDGGVAAPVDDAAAFGVIFSQSPWRQTARGPPGYMSK